MSGIPTSFSSSTRRHSAPDLRTASPVRSDRASFDPKKDLDLFHGMLRNCARGHEAEAAKALFDCLDKSSGTLDLGRLPPRFAQIPYDMPPAAWGFLDLLGPIRRVNLPQAETGHVVSLAFAGLNCLHNLRDLVVLMPRSGTPPSFGGLKLRLQSGDPIKIVVRAVRPLRESDVPSAAASRRRTSLPVLKPIAEGSEPPTPPGASARQTAPGSIEPPTRHLSMSPPTDLQAVAGTRLQPPAKQAPSER